MLRQLFAAIDEITNHQITLDQFGIHGDKSQIGKICIFIQLNRIHKKMGIR